MPAVNVIIRTKNRPLFLARALDDVLGQEFTDWHLFVVQDGTDPAQTQALIDERDFGGRCTLLALPESVGIPAAANRGIAAGDGEFIAIHDDDDTWHPAFLARTVEHLRATDDLAVATRIDIVWEEQIGNRLVETGREGFHPAMLEVTYFDLLRFNHVVPIGMVFRRSAWDELGPMDERCEVVDDWVFNLSLAADRPLRTHRRGARVLAPAQECEGRRRQHRDRRPASAHPRRPQGARPGACVSTWPQHGPGGLLYLAKYIDERSYELHQRLDRIEAQQDEILGLLRALVEEKDKPNWIRKQVREHRT